MQILELWACLYAVIAPMSGWTQAWDAMFPDATVLWLELNSRELVLPLLIGLSIRGHGGPAVTPVRKPARLSNFAEGGISEHSASSEIPALLNYIA